MTVNYTPNLFSLCSLFEGHLTKKSDIYSFGVVLLELMSGKRSFDKNRPSGEHNLVEWAKPYLSNKRKISQVMDPRIEGQYSLREVWKAAHLASQCLSVDSKFRPNIDEVVRSLEHLHDSKNTGSKEHGTSVNDSSNGEGTPIPSTSASPLHS